MFTADAAIAYWESENQLVQETGCVMNRIDQLASPSTSRTLAVAILTSQDVMRDLFQTTLARLFSDGIVVNECRPKVLKRRFGSRQVIAYRLAYYSNKTGRNISTIEVVGKRYADPREGEKAFRTMYMLWNSEFGENTELKIPRPLCYLQDYKLLIQEKAQGMPLSEYLGRGDDGASAWMRLVARWLAKLHRSNVAFDGIEVYEDDKTPLPNYAQELGKRYPYHISQLEELAASIQYRLASFESASRAWIHGDFHPENIFVTRNRATVIDFDQFCQSDPARDLGYFIAQTRTAAYISKGSLEAANSELRILLDAYLADIPPEHKEDLTVRIALYAAQAVLESMHYIFCLLGDDRSDVLSVYLNEMQRLTEATLVSDIII